MATAWFWAKIISWNLCLGSKNMLWKLIMTKFYFWETIFEIAYRRICTVFFFIVNFHHCVQGGMIQTVHFYQFKIRWKSTTRQNGGPMNILTRSCLKHLDINNDWHIDVWYLDTDFCPWRGGWVDKLWTKILKWNEFHSNTNWSLCYFLRVSKNNLENICFVYYGCSSNFTVNVV